MNKIPQYLARKTSVITNTMVKKIKRNINRWEVITDTGNFSSTSVVLTMPLHQAETLLQKSEIENSFFEIDSTYLSTKFKKESLNKRSLGG